MRILIAEVLLLLYSISDIKTREIDIRLVAQACIMTVFIGDGFDIFALFPGVLLIVAASLFPSQIGIGDGVLFTFIGMVCRFEGVISILFITFFITAIISILIIISYRISGKEENINITLPMVPFVLVSFNIVLLLGYDKEMFF